MFDVDITKLLPQFILADKNGYALAKAIEAGLQYMNDRVKEGIACLYDYDSMPEWRLDELAWETNCLYDYNADVEVKREWVRSVISLYRLYGTPDAIRKYVGGYFDDFDLEENWVYNGEPYHFRVIVDGEWTPEKEAWTKRAIDTAKNVRSVLDSVRIGSMSIIAMTAEGKVIGKFKYPLTGEPNTTGTWPQVAVLGNLDTSPNLTVNVDAQDTHFPYTITGTMPNINTDGRLDESEIQSAEADDIYATIAYKLCGQDEI